MHTFAWWFHVTFRCSTKDRPRCLLLKRLNPTILAENWPMGAVRMTSWYSDFNESSPPSPIHKMTGLGGKMMWTMTYAHRPPICTVPLSLSSTNTAGKTTGSASFRGILPKTLQVAQKRFPISPWTHLPEKKIIGQDPSSKFNLDSAKVITLICSDKRSNSVFLEPYSVSDETLRNPKGVL